MSFLQKLSIAWIAGVFLLLFLGSGSSAFLWSLGCLIVWVFNLSLLWGCVAAVVIGAALFGPKVADPYVFEIQQTATRALETRRAPINLTGKTVLFIDAGYYNDVGCRKVCEAIVKYGGAEQVVFGVNRSASKFRPDYPQVLTDWELYAFPDETDGIFPIKTVPVRVTPETIDLVVTVTRTTRLERDRLSKEIGTYGLGALLINYDYFVFEPQGNAPITVADEEPIFALIDMTRNKVGVPHLPGRRTGNWYIQHKFASPSDHWASKHDTDALVFLCGTPERIGYQACIGAFD